MTLKIWFTHKQQTWDDSPVTPLSETKLVKQILRWLFKNALASIRAIRVCPSHFFGAKLPHLTYSSEVPTVINHWTSFSHYWGRQLLKMPLLAKQNICSLFFFFKLLFISLASCPKIRTKLQALLWSASVTEELKIIQHNNVIWNIKKLNLPADLFILKQRKNLARCLSQPAVKLFFIPCQCIEFCG